MSDSFADAVPMRVTCSRAGAFFPLLQKGFQVAVCSGTTLSEVFEQQFGISPGYVTERIKTVFLNGSPVDDFDTAVIGDGDVLALSAAMPGLVGAVMRKGGVLASFRHSISARPATECSAGDQTAVTVKLFNLLIKELGPEFLAAGIGLKA